MSAAFRPRQDRDHARAMHAGAAVAGSAMDRALAAIEAGFSNAGVINSHKLRVERFIRMSFGHPEPRARYRTFIDWFVRENMSLNEACTAVAEERNAYHRLPLVRAIHAELYLILRWLRAKGMHAEFAETIAAMRAPIRHMEAAE